jgi:hypothetical protein
MITSKTKSVMNIEMKVAVLLFVLEMLQKLTGFQAERICGWISIKDPEHVEIGSSPD